MRFAALAALGLLSATAFAVDASAAPLSFTHAGNGSGTLDGVAFANADFAITALGDTDNRVDIVNGFSIDHDSAVIQINGVGTFRFTSPTRTFVSNASETVGFSRGGPDGTDLFDGPSDSGLASWDLSTSFGPITGTGVLLQSSQDPAVTTDGGILVFNGDVDVSATFTAVDAAPTGLPLAIPDNDPAGASSTLSIPSDMTLTDVEVFVDIEHTWVGDLIITLMSPLGTEVTLLDRPGVPAPSSVGCSDNDRPKPESVGKISGIYVR